jgi:hypothetical protein
MDNFDSELEPEDLAELKYSLARALSDRDNWRIHAELSESHLRQIKQSPAWKITKPFRILNLLAWKIKPSLKHGEDRTWIPDAKGQTVFQIVKNQVSIECSNANLENEKIAFLAQWSSTEQVPRSTTLLVGELIECGYSVILISACEALNPLIMDDGVKQKITVIRKPNIGYDFGSWSVAMQILPVARNAKEVLVVNDSLIGPFSSIKNLLTSIEESSFDITGVTDSVQIRHHVQSYLLHFKNGSFQNSEIEDFWNGVRIQEDKMDVVQAYEIGLTATAQANGFYVGAVFPWNLVGQYWNNPSVDRWQRLVDLGFPFIKREVARESKAAKKQTLIPTIEKYFGLSESLKSEISELVE